ncbi:Aldo/keto reductase [Ramaria rubella]|nr:Aldo/keto reductase [Ramaria rubella]
MAAATLKRTGQKMPLVGFGIWKVTKSSTAETVYNAIKSGYRLIDSAGDYGNEKEAGEGVQRAIKDGLVQRQDLFITSKIWNTYHKYEHVKPTAKMQLGHWGLDYFDLFLVHFPVSLKYVDPAERYPPEWWNDAAKTIVVTQKTPFSETWKGMEELVDDGLAKNIGVSNMAGALLFDLHNYARYEPQVLQIEHHPYLTQEPLIKYATEVLGMAVTGYSSFGPSSYIELGADRGAEVLLQNKIISQIAQKHSRTTAQILLRWATQRGIAVIPKSNNHDRVVSNLSSTDFNLSVEELAQISSLNRNLRFNDPADIDPRLAIFA